jgi:uncharacterized protein YgiB involved in biofilm formation
MKRSKLLKIVVLGTAPLLLTGCEEEREAVVYESVQGCVSAAQMAAEVCEQDYQKALDTHANIAPRYRSAPDCETDFGSGQCYHSILSGNSYVPVMKAYMIASLASGSKNWLASANAHTSQPLYETLDSRGWRTASNYRVSNSTPMSVPASTAQPRTSAITMSRSGFGAMGSGHVSWGG